MIQLPVASDTRALVVALGDYPQLDRSPGIQGAPAGARAVVEWLVRERKLSAQHVQAWVTPSALLSLPPELHDVLVREFAWETFQQALDRPRDLFASGSFLVVYFCGHGVVGGLTGEQHLVLPNASHTQLRCIDLANWRTHFMSSGWQRFEHQLWIIDACRSNWAEANRPHPQTWQPGTLTRIPQFFAMSCSKGEESAIDSIQGPDFTRSLLGELRLHQQPGWPDFAAAVRAVAAQWKPDDLRGQTPYIASDWDGSALHGQGLDVTPLLAILDQMYWPEERYRPYVAHALRPAAAVLPATADLRAALEFLNGLNTVEGVAPLWEFAERVARAAGDAPAAAPLRDWLQLRLTPRARAEIESRMAHDPVRARLSLWLRDDLSGTTAMDSELEIVDAAGGVRPWPRHQPKPVSTSVTQAVADWVLEVWGHCEEQAVDLEIDLYLPGARLVQEVCDCVRIQQGGQELRLGEDHPVILHGSDRYKSRGSLDRLRRHAPAILRRLLPSQPAALHWVPATATAETVLAGIKDDAAIGVWLGFDLETPGHAGPLGTALAEGLPAVTWLRLPVEAAARGEILAALPELLSAPLEDLPRRLREWRSARRSVQQHVSVLLDDPARRPKLFRPLAQP